MSPPLSRDDALSVALASLMQGPVYEEENAVAWAALHSQAARVHDHLRVLGMRMVVDDADGYAYLRMQDELPEGMPRLVRRHRMTFHTTVLLILLRQRMTSAEVLEATPRLILTETELVEMMRLYHPEGTSDERIGSDVTRLVEQGFLKRLRGDEKAYEARRIIRAVVSADWLAGYAETLLQQRRDPDPEGGAAGDPDRILVLAPESKP